MTKKNYQAEAKEFGAKTARAMTSNQPFSRKFATEIANYIKGKRLDWAIRYLSQVAEGERHLPLRQYRKKVAHRRGDATWGTKSGRFPKNTAMGWIRLLELVKSNADFKGLDSDRLRIAHAFVSQGIGRGRLQAKGQIGGKLRTSKSCHMEVIVTEAA